jgi:hypothetical protein
LYCATKLIMALISAQNVGAPVWTSIMLPGEEVDYALYSQAGVIENFSPARMWKGTGSNIYSGKRPPITYNFSDISYGGDSSINRGVCPAGNRNLDSYWWPNWTGRYSGRPLVYYNPGEFQLPGGYTYAPPSEFNESQILSGITGFEVEGSFNGNSTGTSSSGALEAIYVTDNPCIFGDNEYGFVYDAAQVAGQAFGTLIFYYSAKTNCGDALPRCYTESSFRNGVEYQATSPLTNITGLIGGATYVVHAYLVPDTPGSHSESYKFRVEVLNTDKTFAVCSVDGGASGNCTVDVPIDPSYVWDHFADQIYGESYVNVVTGIEASGNPTNITTSSGLTIDYVKVGRPFL